MVRCGGIACASLAAATAQLTALHHAGAGSRLYCFLHRNIAAAARIMLSIRVGKGWLWVNALGGGWFFAASMVCGGVFRLAAPWFRVAPFRPPALGPGLVVTDVRLHTDAAATHRSRPSRHSLQSHRTPAGRAGPLGQQQACVCQKSASHVCARCLASIAVAAGRTVGKCTGI